MRDPRLARLAVALMRGHGDVVVAPSLKEAVFRAIYTEVNAQPRSKPRSLEVRDRGWG